MFTSRQTHLEITECYFKTCLPTRQNGVGNRDKTYWPYLSLVDA